MTVFNASKCLMNGQNVPYGEGRAPKIWSFFLTIYSGEQRTLKVRKLNKNFTNDFRVLVQFRPEVINLMSGSPLKDWIEYIYE